MKVKVQLLIMSIVPMLLIGLILTVISVSTLQSNMMKEALDGLQAACNLYREEISTTDADLTTNEIEDRFKTVTGYDYTRFEGDTRASTSVRTADGNRPIGTKAANEVIEVVLRGGKEYTSKRTDVAGQQYCVAYSPIKDATGNITGMAFAGKPRKDIDNEINKVTMIIVSISLLLVCIVTACIYILASKFTNTIISIKDNLLQVASGELNTIVVDNDRTDELGESIEASNSLVEKLKQIISSAQDSANLTNESANELSSTATQISDTTDNVSNAVQEIAKGATEQADAIQKSSENMVILSDEIQSVCDSVDNLKSIANNMSENSKGSADYLQQLQTSMQTISDAMKEISDSINSTNIAVQDITTKVDGITSIAAQTNLLALNASIEAARAGEAGRGFAVVAEEIGKLASESADTAKEIKQVVDNLNVSAENATSKAADVNEIQLKVNDVIKSTITSVEELITSVNSTVGQFDDIMKAADKCNSVKTVIDDALNSLSAISEENAASTQETAAAMEELNATINELSASATTLNDTSVKLTDDLSFFKL